MFASGRKVWIPVPMAAEVAMAELRKVWMKRQQLCHVFVCPWLCTSQWVKLHCVADIVFEVPIGFSCWPLAKYEPLLIGVLFPFLSVCCGSGLASSVQRLGSGRREFSAPILGIVCRPRRHARACCAETAIVRMMSQTSL